MVDDELLTLPEIAQMLQLNPSTIRLWVAEQRLPAHKAGGRKWLVRRGDLERMLEEQPHIGHPKRADATHAPKDWGEVPEQAALDLASSTQVVRRGG